MIEYYVEAVSTYAGDIDGLVWLILLIVGFWFILAELVFVWLIFRFREKPGVRTQYVAGEAKHEKKWISYPHLLVLVCDVAVIAGAVKVWVDIKQTLPEPDAVVRVTGQQWAWTFQHPGPDGELDTEDDIRTVEDLHVEVDKNYHFKLTSKDVLHSFSVPVFRLKQDAVPGREITGWFNATKPGTYMIQCAEMCGVGHGLMPARLHVQTATQHAAWVAEQSGTKFAAAE